MNDPQTEDASNPARRRGAIDIVFIALSVYLTFFGGLMIVTNASHVLNGEFSNLVSIIVGFLAIACATAITARRKEAVWIATALNVLWITPLFGGVHRLPDGFLAGLILVFSVFSPALLCWLPILRRRLDTHDDGPLRWRWLTKAALLSLALMAVVLVISEGSRIRTTLQVDKLQRQCAEAQDVNACSEAARLNLRNAETIEGTVSAAQQFRDVCNDHRNGLACTWWAHTQSRWMLPATQQSESLLLDRRREQLSAQCRAGSVPACWAARILLSEPDELLDKMESAFEAACADGEALACDLLTRVATPERKARACAAGWSRHCESAPADARADCWRGDAKRCQEVDSADALEGAVYTAMAGCTAPDDRLSRIRGFIGCGPLPDPVRLRAACEQGHAWGCFGAGLVLVEGERDDWRPQLPPAEVLDATFGRACELGMDAACVAYTVRLFDVLSPDDAAIARGNELADIACARGSHHACWLRDYSSSILDDDYAPLRESARQTCAAAPDADHPGCITLANLIAHQLEASPSPMDDRVYFHLVRDICEELGPPAACRRVTYMLMHDDAAPFEMRRVAYDGAAKACAQKDHDGCVYLTYVPDSFHSTPGTREELEASVCAKSGFCDTENW